MTDLDDEDRALLDLARELDAPSDRDRARVRAALAARLGAAAGLTAAAAAGLGASTQAATAATGAATAATGAGAGGAAAVGGLGATIAAKLAGAALVVSMTVGVGATVVHHHRRARLAAIAPPAHGTPAGHATPRRAASAGNLDLRGNHRFEEPPGVAPAPPVVSVDRGKVAPPPRATQPVASAPGRRGEARRATEQAGAKEATAAARPERPPTPTVADEARLVHAGVLAMRDGQPGRALELFDRHAVLYPDGVLSEERDAERALALADLGRVADAAAAIGEFLRAHPASALGARLRDRQRLLDAGRR